MLAVIGSILLGMVVISGLVKEGEMGCMGPFLIMVLLFVLIGVLGIGFLMALGGGV